MYQNCQFLGNLVRDPETKNTPGGAMVCKVSIATNNSFKKKDGTKVDKATFHDLEFWGKAAEILAQYCEKGTKLFISKSRHEVNTWDKDDGSKGYFHKFVVSEFKILSWKSEESPAHDQESTAQAAPDDDEDGKEIPF